MRGVDCLHGIWTVKVMQHSTAVRHLQCGAVHLPACHCNLLGSPFPTNRLFTLAWLEGQGGFMSVTV